MATPAPINATADQAYDALYQNVGDGLRGPPEGILEAWRHARAEGLAAVTVDWRAALQAFPQYATDFIPVYEELLNNPVDPTLAIGDVQEELAVKYTQVIDATNPSLLVLLQKIDPRFSIYPIDPNQSTTTECDARPFEDWNPASPQACGPAFDLNGRTYTLFPNYSSDFILPVLLAIGGTFTEEDKRVMQLAKDSLNDALPSWVDFRIFGSLGFILDVDLLDVTAFGS